MKGFSKKWFKRVKPKAKYLLEDEALLGGIER
jgi:hypothetical protein